MFAGSHGETFVVRHGRTWFASALRCACEAFGPDHLVAGSDYPVPLMYEGYGKTLQERHTKGFSCIKEAGLPCDVVEQILHCSATDLFGVPRG
jgi:6-methylsalicylate decarboxylase